MYERPGVRRPDNQVQTRWIACRRKLVASVRRWGVRSRLISRCSRLSAFTEFDYKLIARLVESVGRLIASPNLLTEVSNLAGKLGEDVMPVFFAKFADKLRIIDEDYIEGLLASKDESFTRLGLTDATII